MTAELHCVAPSGIEMDWPVDRHLQPVYDLLANEANASVTLTKPDGRRFVYTLARARRETQHGWPCKSSCEGNPCSICGFTRRETP